MGSCGHDNFPTLLVCPWEIHSAKKIKVQIDSSQSLEWLEGQMGSGYQTLCQLGELDQYLLWGGGGCREMRWLSAGVTQRLHQPTDQWMAASLYTISAYCRALTVEADSKWSCLNDWLSLNPKLLEGLSPKRKHFPSMLLVVSLSWIFGGVYYTEILIVFVL